MTNRALKRRWLRTKIALSHTMEKILDINRRRKSLATLPSTTGKEDQLQEELRLLNRIADYQARMLRKYELDLQLVQDRA